MNLDKTILELANMLGIALTDIYAVYTEAIAGIAIINLVGFVIFCITMIATFKITITKIVARNTASAYESDRERNSFFKFDFEEDFSIVVITMICTFLIIGMSCVICTEAIQHYIYPEYFAIKQMLSTFGT